MQKQKIDYITDLPEPTMKPKDEKMEFFKMIRDFALGSAFSFNSKFIRAVKLPTLIPFQNRNQLNFLEMQKKKTNAKQIVPEQLLQKLLVKVVPFEAS